MFVDFQVLIVQFSAATFYMHKSSSAKIHLSSSCIVLSRIIPTCLGVRGLLPRLRCGAVEVFPSSVNLVDRFYDKIESCR